MWLQKRYQISQIKILRKDIVFLTIKTEKKTNIAFEFHGFFGNFLTYKSCQIFRNPHEIMSDLGSI